MRVLPSGVGTLEERLRDLSSRYGQRPNLIEKSEACREIEKQVQKKVSVNLGEINKKKIWVDSKNIKEVEI